MFQVEQFTLFEVIAEVALQLGDSLDMSRAESRGHIIKIANNIIDEGLINNDSEDIDEIITTYLKRG